MPKLPTFEQLGFRDPRAAGSLPSYPGSDPVATAQAAEGKALTSLGASIFGRSVGYLTDQIKDQQDKQKKLELARADSDQLIGTAKLNQQRENETDPNALKGYGASQQQVTDAAGNNISDPAERELWLTKHRPVATTQQIQADKRIASLNQDASLAADEERLTGLQDSIQRAKTPEEAQLYISKADNILQAQADAGYISDVRAVQRKAALRQQLAINYTLAQPPGERLAMVGGWEGRLINRESAGRPDVVNQLGYAGLYQFGAPLLTQLGVYRPGDNEDLKTWAGTPRTAVGKWSGTFDIPGFPNVKTIDDFRSNPAAQKAVFQKTLAYYDQEIADRGLDQYIGSVVGGVPITREGIYAMMHLGGPAAAQRALITDGWSDARDANGSTVLSYARMAAGGGRPSVDQLRVKGGPGGQAFAGGAVTPGVIDLASTIQANEPGLVYFSAFNDAYHAGSGSQHAKGLGFDFTIKDPSQSEATAGRVKSMLVRAGLEPGADFQVLDEYKNPSPHATGGHIHVAFKSPEAAAKFSGAVPQSTSSVVDVMTPYQREQVRAGAEQELVKQGRLQVEADRAERSTVTSLIKDDTNSIATTGVSIPDLTQERVDAALGPEQAKEFAINRHSAQRYYDQTNDLETLPTGEIVQRVDSLAPRPGSNGFTVQKKWHDTAVKRAKDILDLRKKDPAAAVDNFPDVAAVKQNASLDKPETYRDLAKKRIEAQDRIGIPEDLQSPITQDEARQLWKPIETAAPTDQREVLKDTIEQINAAFGDMGDQVLQSVLKEGHADKQVRTTTAAVLRKLARGDMPTSDEAKAVDEAHKDAATRAAVAPVAPIQLPSAIDPTTGMPDPMVRPAEPAKPAMPVPDPRAIDLLRKNPALRPKFDRVYGPGAADKFLGM